MTKAAIRRQEAERQAREVAEAQQRARDTEDAVRLQPSLPRMDPPPPYDEAHLPSHVRDQQRAQNSRLDEDSGCLNYDSPKGCMNYKSEDGCLNYKSKGGCLNYKSEDGCLNYRSSEGCLNYYSDSGCLNWRNRKYT